MFEKIINMHGVHVFKGNIIEKRKEKLLYICAGLAGVITAKGKPLLDHNMVKDHQDALVRMLCLKREYTRF